MEDVKPLLARIQALKSDDSGALFESQLMAFFLQHRVQPLQHRLSKLWLFSGLGDSSRISDDLLEKKDLDKRVRALTILTKEDEIPDLTANYFNSEHHLPVVRAMSSFAPLLFTLLLLFLMSCDLFSFQDHQFLISCPPLPEGGDIQNVLVSAASEAPKVEDNQDGDECEDSLKDTSSTTSPPPALSEDRGVDKKRKRVAEVISSSTLAHMTVIGETSAPEREVELFDLLDS
jgi:hypothetical protein